MIVLPDAELKNVELLETTLLYNEYNYVLRPSKHFTKHYKVGGCDNITELHLDRELSTQFIAVMETYGIKIEKTGE